MDKRKQPHSKEHNIKIGLSNLGKNKGKHNSSSTELKKGNKMWLGKHHKEESKLKIGYNNWTNGKKQSKEFIEKRFKNLIGKHHSEEWVANISKGNIGKHHSEETRLKLIEKRKYRVFPIKDTSIEVKIQSMLKQLGIEFLTHQYMKDIEHGYQCDIIIPSMKTIIECFGTYWHNYPKGRDIDTIRCNELRKAGWKVIVLWENEIKVMELNDLEMQLR